MKHILTVLLAYLSIVCTSCSENEKQYPLQGVWTLRLMDYPTGHIDTFPQQNQTVLRLYDRDSTMYECRVTKTETGLMITPYIHCTVTLIRTNEGGYIYMEGRDPHPLTIVDDSTITIQQDGVLCTWHGADDIAKEWGDDMLSAMTADLRQDGSHKVQSYVLSAKERSLTNIIYVFIFSSVAVIVLLLLIVRIAIQNRKAKRQLQLQLQQIQEVPGTILEAAAMRSPDFVYETPAIWEISCMTWRAASTVGTSVIIMERLPFCSRRLQRRALRAM